MSFVLTPLWSETWGGRSTPNTDTDTDPDTDTDTDPDPDTDPDTTGESNVLETEAEPIENKRVLTFPWGSGTFLTHFPLSVFSTHFPLSEFYFLFFSLFVFFPLQIQILLSVQTEYSTFQKIGPSSVSGGNAIVLLVWFKEATAGLLGSAGLGNRDL